MTEADTVIVRADGGTDVSDIVRAAIAVCLTYHASVTSWIRTPKHNASLPGSVPNSAHLWGGAVDVIYDGPRPPVLEVLRLVPRTVRVVREATHDHLELRAAPPAPTVRGL